MDYILFSTLIGVVLLCVMLSYDIACQHSKNIKTRMALYNKRLHVDLKGMRYAVPKNHIAIHGLNHSRWSFNYLRWVGRTCCEGIESCWGHMNPVSMSTKQMAPALRREVLDDHWVWNWNKVVNMGEYTNTIACAICSLIAGPYFLRLLKVAFKMHGKQTAVFEQYSHAFPSVTVKQWEKDIAAWEKDPFRNGADPFEQPVVGAFMGSVTEDHN